MIRDPSDGTVREEGDVETPSESAAAPEKPIDDNALIATSTSGLRSDLETLKSAITAGKVKPEHLSVEWVYQRAWNDALEFALREIGKIEKAKMATTTTE